ncbi:STAS domain-containing protein [Fictibacillus gelatini]|uniref:STAS domain-containing protein n=1 Tax=Fictibacillus gelatini TaxID=225985 RepID=UPI00040096B9|nr:STAS domain-containing protein [Fictibacillus gelatini]
MHDKNKALYDYLISHANEITDEWLGKRKYSKNSVYSLEKDADYLRKTNQWVIQILSSSLLDAPNTIIELNEWAQKTASERVRTDTPIYEVIHQFKVFRNVFWDKIHSFVNDTTLQITPSDIIEWEKKINSTLDEVIERFTESYNEITTTRLVAQEALINELSSPIIPIAHEIGVLPLIGVIDTKRAKYIMESTLQQCTSLKISRLFIDLSGVAIMDTMVAQEIFQVIQTLKLIGVETTLSGIRPEVAQTAVNLGIDFSNLSISSTLQQALMDLHLTANKKT